MSKNSSVDQKRAEAFSKAVQDINKKYQKESSNGDRVVAKMSDEPRKVKRVSTGSLVLDHLNGGGFPVGRIVEVYGPEASGKTSISLIACGNVQKNGGTAVYIDLEQALDPEYAQSLGVDIDNLAVAQPDSGEQALNLMKDFIQTGVVDMIVLDSIGAMSTKAQIEGRAEDMTIGAVARLLSKELRQVATLANKNDTLCLFINQLRSKIGGYGNPEVTTGGNAMKFTASQRIDIRRKEVITGDDGKAIGNKVKIKVVKNKTGRPFGEGFTYITYGKGINRATEVLELGLELGVIEKASSVTYVDTTTGEKITGRGYNRAMEAIEADQGLMERLADEINKRLKADSSDESNNDSEENEEHQEEETQNEESEETSDDEKNED